MTTQTHTLCQDADNCGALYKRTMTCISKKTRQSVDSKFCDGIPPPQEQQRCPPCDLLLRFREPVFLQNAITNQWAQQGRETYRGCPKFEFQWDIDQRSSCVIRKTKDHTNNAEIRVGDFVQLQINSWYLGYCGQNLGINESGHSWKLAVSGKKEGDLVLVSDTMIWSAAESQHPPLFLNTVRI